MKIVSVGTLATAGMSSWGEIYRRHGDQATRTVYDFEHVTYRP